ncbi:MAG: trypsin-like peptidase domain-containing protein [Bacteriovoracaceae bacterium]|jgi:hypothetical protein|nr:trypsin-like peptidase domain-containing protein [Bacteriovoracaceae bacterium]
MKKVFGLTLVILANLAWGIPREVRLGMEGLGYLNIGGASFCNAVMISPSYALTNNHCVSTQEACDETFMVFTRDGEERIGSYQCRRVLATGDKGEAGLDYTLLEFEDYPGFWHGSVPLADMSDSVKYPKEGFEIWRLKVDPPGFIKRRSLPSYALCFGKLATDTTEYMSVDPDYLDRPCHTQQGNSGGAFLDGDGKLLGLTAQGELDEKESHPEINDIVLKELKGPTIRTILLKIPHLKDLIKKDVPMGDFFNL